MEEGGGRIKDIDLLEHITKFIAGKSFCPFGEAAVWGLQSNLAKFRGEFDRVYRADQPGERSADAFRFAPSTGPTAGQPSVATRQCRLECAGESPLNRDHRSGGGPRDSFGRLTASCFETSYFVNDTKRN